MGNAGFSSKSLDPWFINHDSTNGALKIHNSCRSDRTHNQKITHNETTTTTTMFVSFINQDSPLEGGGGGGEIDGKIWWKQDLVRGIYINENRGYAHPLSLSSLSLQRVLLLLSFSWLFHSFLNKIKRNGIPFAVMRGDIIYIFMKNILVNRKKRERKMQYICIYASVCRYIYIYIIYINIYLLELLGKNLWLKSSRWQRRWAFENY